jgi:hypothetical protein
VLGNAGRSEFDLDHFEVRLADVQKRDGRTLPSPAKGDLRHTADITGHPLITITCDLVLAYESLDI